MNGLKSWRAVIPGEATGRVSWRRAGSRQLLALLLVIILCSPPQLARAQQGWDNPGAGMEDQPSSKGARLDDPFERALQMIARGNCKEALPILSYYAQRRVGGEIALLEIGHCMIVKGGTETKPDLAQADIDYGLGQIIKAADAGLRDAQEEMIRMYLDGKYLPYDPPEAGKWYYVWKRNIDPVGDLPFDPALMVRLRKSLTAANWRDGEARARDWRRVAHTDKGTVPLP